MRREIEADIIGLIKELLLRCKLILVCGLLGMIMGGAFYDIHYSSNVSLELTGGLDAYTDSLKQSLSDAEIGNTKSVV